MKKSTIAAFAAAALTAGVALAQNDPLASTMTLTKDSATTLTMTTIHRACTSDAHLVTITQTDIVPVIETRKNKIKTEELRAAGKAYGETTGPIMDKRIQKLLSFMDSQQVAKMIEQGRDVIGTVNAADLGGSDNLHALADLIKAQEPDMAAAQQKFSEAVVKALDGHLYDPSRYGGRTATVTPAPAPQCAPKP